MHHLDQPIWSALSTRQANLALGDSHGRRFPPEFSPLAAVKENTAAAFASLGKVTSATDNLGLCFADEPWLPPDWELRTKFAVVQMVCEKLLDCETYKMEVLTKEDVPEMIALVKLTQPGPFAERTIEFGTFQGIRNGAKLVAMAGERLKIAGGFDEVSGVCTHPDYQGRGYGRALTYAVAKRISEMGNTPFLHVRADNAVAIRTYESLGFVHRRHFVFAVIRKKKSDE